MRRMADSRTAKRGLGNSGGGRGGRDCGEEGG